MQRTPALLSGALLTLALIGGTVSPAHATPAAVDASTTVQLEGDLLVLAGGDRARDASNSPTPHANEVLLVTDAGARVELTGDDLENVVSGSTFSGTVSMPADVLAEVEQQNTGSLDAGDVIDGESDLGATILDATVDLDAALQVVEATVTAPVVDRTVTARAHTLDIVVATLPGWPSEPVMTNTAISAMVANLNTYWPSQTARQVSGVSQPSAVKRIISDNACDPETVWEEAAPQFGFDTDHYWWNDDSAHLVVIAPESCGGGTGLGSVGGLGAGGLVWVDHLPSVTVAAVAHEFGHNLGLNHSNALLCNDNSNVSEGSGCSIEEYWDSYDIMGAPLYYEGQVGNVSSPRLMALNVTHRYALDALSGTDLPALALDDTTPFVSQSFTIQPASALSGLRGIRATDPVSGTTYFVEYRNGTGMDLGAMYAADAFYGLGLGVRILTLDTDGSSTAITRPASIREHRDLFFPKGSTFTSSSGRLKVAVTGTGATAQVTVTLGKKPLTFTATPVPTISGAPQVDQILKATAGTWSPAPVSLAYQWSSDGFAIPGATASTYVPTEADLRTRLSVSVTGTKPDYTSVTRMSAVTAQVIDAVILPAPAVDRFAGVDRYSTGVEISKRSFEPGVPVVYVATGLSFPDALAAAPAAAAQNGPLLLTAVNALPKSVLDEIDRLDPEKIVVVGGTGAVSASVYTQLSTLTPEIRRDAGTDRFATSRVIVERAFTEGSETAFVATAWGFPDALAASAAAGAIGAPVILVDGKATTVDAKTQTLLSTLGVAKAVVAGGTGVVSTQVEASLKTTRGAENVSRLGGTDRYGTAGVINRASFTQSDTVYLANGLGFADALGGAALAGKNKAPLYTVYANCVPKHVLEDIVSLRTTEVVLLGGAGVLTQSVTNLTACK
ncbi:MAG: cell wall-binding repeat-containing protein [Mycetocola sp.]